MTAILIILLIVLLLGGGYAFDRRGNPGLGLGGPGVSIGSILVVILVLWLLLGR